MISLKSIKTLFVFASQALIQWANPTFLLMRRNIRQSPDTAEGSPYPVPAAPRGPFATSLRPFTAPCWPARTCVLPALSSAFLLSNPQARSRMFSSSANKPPVSAPRATRPSLQGTTASRQKNAVYRDLCWGRCTTGQQSKKIAPWEVIHHQTGSALLVNRHCFHTVQILH